MTLVQEGRQQGWWQAYELHQFATFVELEAGAAAIRNFHSTLVPGLLQTAPYAKALAEHEVSEPPPEIVDKRVEVRIIRQRLLTQPGAPHVWSILDQSVLHRAVGGPAVMADQLDRLVEAAKMSNVTIQVIPDERGAHAGAGDSSFTIFEFTGQAPAMVSTEGLFGLVYLERPSDVERYQRAFESLRTIALDERDSIGLIMNMRSHLNGGF
jgi:hypothetical protein